MFGSGKFPVLRWYVKALTVLAYALPFLMAVGGLVQAFFMRSAMAQPRGYLDTPQQMSPLMYVAPPLVGFVGGMFIGVTIKAIAECIDVFLQIERNTDTQLVAAAVQEDL